MPPLWQIRLGREAERDFVAILGWTAETFGRRQAERYRATLKAALEALASGPKVPGSKERDEIGAGIRTIRVARGGRHASHLVVYRVSGDHQIDVLRILHESMDLTRHSEKPSEVSDE